MLRPGTLFWKLFLGTTLLIVLVLGTCAWIIVRHVDRFYDQEVAEHLRAEAAVIRHVARPLFDRAHQQELDRFAKALNRARDGGLRITMILADGAVLADSEADPHQMESHANRPEVRAALARGWGEHTRHSRTVDRVMKYVALRVGPEVDPVGVVRVSITHRAIIARAEAIQHLIWTITLLGLLAAVVFALGLASIWSNPIRRITAIARSLSDGDLSARADVRGSDEMSMLAKSLNQMRDHLANQLATIDRQRRSLESLLTQVHEGVVVAGPDGRIALINPAAAWMLRFPDSENIPSRAMVGRAVRECVTHPELRDMLLGETNRKAQDYALNKSGMAEPVAREIRIQRGNGEEELSLLARAADIVLPGFERDQQTSGLGKRRPAGRLLVLTDITELTRTVRVKMDFASNASHELRTPLSTIRAAIETLVNLDLTADPRSARGFLDVIDRQTARMEQMVADLLSVSRIESSPTQFKPQPLSLPHFFEELKKRFLERLHAKELQWTLSVPPDLTTMHANSYLLGITLDNLVDNAIKFTDTGGRISLYCEWDGTSGGPGRAVSIAVADDGCGIPENERGRVFERFYQVEKARSGADRGTGLGLSIVRHAVTAMNGTVRLDSQPGQGTSVTITIPQPE